MKQLIDIFLPIEWLALPEEIVKHLKKFWFINVYQLFNKKLFKDKYNLEYGIVFKSSYLSNKVYACFDKERIILIVELIEFFNDTILYIPPLKWQSWYETLKLFFRDDKDVKLNWEKIITNAIMKNYFRIRNAGIKYDRKYHEPARAYIVRYLRWTKDYDFVYNNDYSCLEKFSDWQIQKVIDILIEKWYFFQKFDRYYKNWFPVIVLTPKWAEFCLKLTPKEDILEHDHLVKKYLQIDSERFWLNKMNFF